MDLQLLFIKFHEYTSQFKNDEDNGIKVIKTILREIVTLKSLHIWKYYDVLKQHSQKDQHIYKWINNLIHEDQTKQLDSIVTHIIANIHTLDPSLDQSIFHYSQLLSSLNRLSSS